MKSDYNSKVEKLEAKFSGLSHSDINIKDLLDKGIDILLKLDYIYETADIERNGKSLIRCSLKNCILK